jgi:CBS domain-containing protein
MLTTRDLMLDNPKSVAPDAPVKEARLLMESEGYMQLPVLQQGRLVGIITDRDLCISARYQIESNKTVEDCMTANPITVTPETPVLRAAQMLSTYKFGALPVVDGGKLVGLITTSLLLAYFANKWDRR